MTSIKYVNPHIMEFLISNKLGIVYQDLKKYIVDIKVNINCDDIKKYLNDKFERENKFLKEKIEKYNYKYPNDKYLDLYNARGYIFDELTYKYFVNHINELKNKIIKMLNIIDSLINNEFNKDMLIDNFIDLDITLVDGKILFSDIDRLIIPIIDNIYELVDLYYLANDLETYSSFYMSKDYLFRNGISFDDLQIYGEDFNYKYATCNEKQKLKKAI